MSVSINCKFRYKVEMQVHGSCDLFVVICKIYTGKLIKKCLLLRLVANTTVAIR